MTEQQGSWRQDARCREIGTEAFYAEPAVDMNLVHAAIDVCRGCRVKDDCLEEALATEEGWGIWGATTPRQRRAIQRSRRTPTPRATCGTRQGYQTHLNNSETACPQCLKAQRDYRAASRLRTPRTA